MKITRLLILCCCCYSFLWSTTAVCDIKPVHYCTISISRNAKIYNPKLSDYKITTNGINTDQYLGIIKFTKKPDAPLCEESTSFCYLARLTEAITQQDVMFTAKVSPKNSKRTAAVCKFGFYIAYNVETNSFSAKRLGKKDGLMSEDAICQGLSLAISLGTGAIVAFTVIADRPHDSGNP